MKQVIIILHTRHAIQKEKREVKVILKLNSHFSRIFVLSFILRSWHSTGFQKRENKMHTQIFSGAKTDAEERVNIRSCTNLETEFSRSVRTHIFSCATQIWKKEWTYDPVHSCSKIWGDCFFISFQNDSFEPFFTFQQDGFVLALHQQRNHGTPPCTSVNQISWLRVPP